MRQTQLRSELRMDDSSGASPSLLCAEQLFRIIADVSRPTRPESRLALLEGVVDLLPKLAIDAEARQFNEVFEYLLLIPGQAHVKHFQRARHPERRGSCPLAVRRADCSAVLCGLLVVEDDYELRLRQGE